MSLHTSNFYSYVTKVLTMYVYIAELYKPEMIVVYELVKLKNNTFNFPHGKWRRSQNHNQNKTVRGKRLA